MARVIWSPEALAQLRHIVEYVQLFDPAAARSFSERLFALGESLADFPRRGRPAANGTRELVTVRPYILRYHVEPEEREEVDEAAEDGGADEEVSILGIRHAAQLADD